MFWFCADFLKFLFLFFFLSFTVYLKKKKKKDFKQIALNEFGYDFPCCSASKLKIS